jgi:polyferredoxin
MSHELLIEYQREGSELVSKSSVPGRRKISPGLRRQGPKQRAGLQWYRRILWRLKNDSQFLRTSVQASFVLLCIWIGIEFYLFVRWGETNGASQFVSRPPGVEGFLPISALMSLKYWFDTGVINQIHPSGLFILLAIVVISIGLKKAFCGWLCPIGTMSESLWLFGQKLFGKNLQITKWIDYPLRGVKYLLLLFFAYSISQMDVQSMKAFIESPYNRMADVKMYLFFANISSIALWTVLVLVALSIVVKNFWCRYLCPYGALLGSFSMLSPVKITRQQSSCIDCELCTRECPAAIKIHEVERVWSDECMACMKCVEVCPVKNTLDMRLPNSNRAVPNWVFGSLVAGIFVAITGLAMLSGNWQNSISKSEYELRFQQLNSGVYQHPFGAAGAYGPNK